MNSEKKSYNEDAEKPTEKNDNNIKKTASKKFLQTFKTIIEVISVCIVYVSVLYFLVVAERAFALWNNTVDIICSSILRLLIVIILPIMLALYLNTKIKQKWLIGIIYAIVIIIWRLIYLYVGIPDMNYIFEYGKLFQ